jgi:C-terminal processing protease CtpA/Prc
MSWIVPSSQSTKVFLLTLVTLGALAHGASAQNADAGQWEDVLKLVSADVQKNFYDPGMKGLDWAKLTEETRQRIAHAKSNGEMILAISVLLTKLQDSHTYFVPPPLTARSDFGFKARSYGDEIRVFEVTKKGPSDKAGLQAGDRILSVNGVPLDRSNVREVMRLVTAVVPASSLEVSVASSGAHAHVVRVPAHVITMQEHQYIDSVFRVADRQRAMDAHPNFLHKEYENGTWYVRIPAFTASPDATFAEINRAQHARALILDLRGNPGGWEQTLLSFLGFFAEQPEVLARRVSRSPIQDVAIKPGKSGFSSSIIIMVDSDTGSAAELAARHLQASHKATVMGDVTSGTVNEGRIIPEKIGAQFVMPFAVVVTQAKLVLPDGEELEGRGVIPDVRCLPTPEELAREVDSCLDRAVDLASKSLPQGESH